MDRMWATGLNLASINFRTWLPGESAGWKDLWLLGPPDVRLLSARRLDDLWAFVTVPGIAGSVRRGGYAVTDDRATELLAELTDIVSAIASQVSGTRQTAADQETLLAHWLQFYRDSLTVPGMDEGRLQYIAQSKQGARRRSNGPASGFPDPNWRFGYGSYGLRAREKPAYLRRHK